MIDWKRLFLSIILLCCAIVLGHATAQAQTVTPVLIDDINQGTAGTNPYGVTQIGDKLYYAATDLEHGTELWSIPVAGGQPTLFDIYPGVNSSSPAFLTSMGDGVIFAARHPHPTLWRVDSAGLEQLTPGAHSINNHRWFPDRIDQSRGCSLAVANGTAFFTLESTTDSSQTGLWRSDGTPEGAFLLKETQSTIDGRPPDALYPAENFVFFFISTSDGDEGLWRSDGTSAGTMLIQQWPLDGSASLSVEVAAILENRLLFILHYDDRHELWVSDGTPGGAQKLTASPFLAAQTLEQTSAANERGQGEPDWCTLTTNTIVGSRAYLQMGNNLWVSDGTISGTALLTSISMPPIKVSTVNGIDYLQDGGEYLTEEVTIIATDGTPAGTRQPNLIETGWSAALNNQLILGGRKGGIRGIWVSDGTQSGTTLVKELPENHYIRQLYQDQIYPYSDLILFQIVAPPYARSLWRTDGTPEGTFEIGVLSLPDHHELRYNTEALRMADGSVIFTGESPSVGLELFKTDADITESTLLVDTNAHETLASDPHDFTVLGDQVFFIAVDGEGMLHLWRTEFDGSNLQSIAELTTGGKAGDMSATAERLYFYVETAERDVHTLWVSDGTPTGTLPLHEMFSRRFPQYENSIDENATPDFAAAPDRYYFLDLNDDSYGLWVTEGTPESTRPVTAGLDVQRLLWTEDALYLSGWTGVWSSDGDTGVVSLVAERPSGYFDFFPIFSTDGIVYLQGFGSDMFGDVPHLHVWQGGDTFPLIADVRPQQMLSVNGTLLFSTEWGALWRTDGTPAGTEEIADYDDIFNLRVTDSKLYYWAYTEGTYMLGESDGSPAGTRLLLDSDILLHTLSSVFSHAMFRLETVGNELFVWVMQTGNTNPSSTDNEEIYCDLWHVGPETAIPTLVYTFFHDARSSNDYSVDYSCGGEDLTRRFFTIPDKAELGGRLFFSQMDRAHEREPWVLATDEAPVAEYALSVDQTGNGTIVTAPQQATYAFGTQVTLTAEPATGWRFVEWAGDASSTDNPFIVTMNGAKSIVAHFEPLEVKEYFLITEIEGEGEVTRSAPGPYASGSQVTLTAEPVAGWRFMEWTGDASGTDNPFTVTMTSDKFITAHFEQITYTLTTSIEGQGQVSRSTDGPYAAGAQVTLTAVPAAGWRFVEWTGDVDSTDNPLTVTMNSAKMITAVFRTIILPADSMLYLPIVTK